MISLLSLHPRFKKGVSSLNSLSLDFKKTTSKKLGNKVW